MLHPFAVVGRFLRPNLSSLLPSPACCASPLGRATSAACAATAAGRLSSRRTYLHFARTVPEDYELPIETMPSDVDALMKAKPKDLDFFGNYWYWRLRGEASVLDPENLPKKSYKQLARDMGLQVVNQESEHMVGLLELYEYLKGAPFVGPFGTIENPVLVPSVHTESEPLERHRQTQIDRGRRAFLPLFGVEGAGSQPL
ncbi:uncharacterized protein LOC34621015, partial [Cyclospora cayetanensis]|uniref:Uncharacterized protein LOC34621015 n=1 Tax=Cyclospora cayetanensis TaxID=88456 RepID=A0A6P6RXW4_9EIME